MGDPQKSDEDRREIPIDIIQAILLRLPTKDFVRSSCICKLWRSIVADPSLRKLHVAHHTAAASSEPEVLHVTETREVGRSDEAIFFNLSSAKAMSQVAIPSGYHLAGVCNDFLCFVLEHEQAPAVVCNPVTGETLHLPKAPPFSAKDGQLSHLFVLGFSPPTKEYKMFRLSFPQRRASKDETNYIAVYTLGDGGGWRQRSYPSRFLPLQWPAPVHTDENIFVPAADLFDEHARAARILVLDVATETPRFYRIPYNYSDYHGAWDTMMAECSDLNGQMCLAMYVCSSRVKIQFWVMKPPGEIEAKDNGNDDDKLHWDLRYSFFFDGPFYVARPRGPWIDHLQTLCYRLGNFVYTYDTKKYSSSSSADSILIEKRLDLPNAPSSSSESYVLWSICGGYRPSLLSPLIFALPPSQNEKGKKRRGEFEHNLLCALRYKN